MPSEPVGLCCLLKSGRVNVPDSGHLLALLPNIAALTANKSVKRMSYKHLETRKRCSAILSWQKASLLLVLYGYAAPRFHANRFLIMSNDRYKGFYRVPLLFLLRTIRLGEVSKR